MGKKAILLLVIGIIGAHVVVNAQVTDKAAWLGKKTVVANIGYGTINLVKQKLFKQSFDFDKEKITATGPFAIGIEYGFSNKIGGGIQIGFGQIKGVYTQKGILGGMDYVETLTYKTLQALAILNYHLAIFKKVDTYVGAGLGFISDKLRSTRNISVGTSFVSGNEISPLTYTFAVGGRYYFKPTIGVYAELGYVSGSLLQLGLVGRF